MAVQSTEPLGCNARQSLGPPKVPPQRSYHSLQVCVNAIAVVPRMHSTPEDKLGLGVYPRAAMLNHSCAPNVTSYFSGATLHVRALAAMGPGTTLRLCYGPQVRRTGCQCLNKIGCSGALALLLWKCGIVSQGNAQGCNRVILCAQLGETVREVRSEQLLRTYHFECGCSACCAPDGDRRDAELVGLLCHHCRGPIIPSEGCKEGLCSLAKLPRGLPRAGMCLR